MNDSTNITPIQLLIEAQRQLALELVEQRRVNSALNEALYKLSADIKLLSSQIGRHDQIENKVGELHKEVQSLQHGFKSAVQTVLDSQTEPRLKDIDERVKTLEKNLYRFGGAITLFVFLVGSYKTFMPS